MHLNHLGIVTALLPETKYLVANPVVRTPMPLSNKVTLYVSGMGTDNAARGARALIRHGADRLISFGTAGALAPTLYPGDLIVPESVISYNNGPHTLDNGWRIDTLNKLVAFNHEIHQGKLLQADQVVLHPDEKTRLHNQTGAIAVDMESLSVINVARDAKIPVLVLRVIVDPVTMVIPAFVMRASNDYGEISLISLFGSLIFAPTRILPLIQLSKSFREAGKSLSWVGKHLHHLVRYAFD